jgi:3-keto-5-aminohexanoate cleavage enzyme
MRSTSPAISGEAGADQKGLVSPPYLFQFVMGYQTASFQRRRTSSLSSPSCGKLPVQHHRIGKNQWALTTLSVILGGCPRGASRTNLTRSGTASVRATARRVEKIVRIARELNREIATPEQAREMLGLSSAPRKY